MPLIRLASEKVDSPDSEGLRLGTLSTVAHPDRAKRVGDGRQGEPLAGLADGLPEARACCKSLWVKTLREKPEHGTSTNPEENRLFYNSPAGSYCPKAGSTS